jgi:predicted nicotinamide N-methyase
LFAHHLWNAALLLGEALEAATLHVTSAGWDGLSRWCDGSVGVAFNMTGRSVIELGCGSSALPATLCALLGASKVVATDYPSEELLRVVRENVKRNAVRENSPLVQFPTALAHGITTDETHGFEPVAVEVLGHEWGDVQGIAKDYKATFDRVLLADCLWMPWLHDKLRRSVAHFLAENLQARALVTAGFHTGRDILTRFLDANDLAQLGLQVENIWERDVDGAERRWDMEREEEDVRERKRWLVICVMKRIDTTKGGLNSH